MLFCFVAQNFKKINSSEDTLTRHLLILYELFILSVQGRPFEVKEMFLEDILRTTGYTNKEMVKYKKEKQRGWWTS